MKLIGNIDDMRQRHSTNATVIQKLYSSDHNDTYPKLAKKEVRNLDEEDIGAVFPELIDGELSNNDI